MLSWRSLTREALMSKLTLVLDPSQRTDIDPLMFAQGVVAVFFAEESKAELIRDKELQLTWYNDEPASPGVSVTGAFASLRAFDALAELQIFLRKNGFTVHVVLGY